MKAHKITIIFDKTNIDGVHHTAITPEIGDVIQVDFPREAGEKEQF